MTNFLKTFACIAIMLIFLGLSLIAFPKSTQDLLWNNGLYWQYWCSGINSIITILFGTALSITLMRLSDKEMKKDE